MANSYTNTLRLIEMGNGDQSGTWGATTNQNLATLLCQAITGVTTVTLSSTAKTLTTYDGVSDESRNAVIKLDGTPGGAATVKVPNSSKVYIFYNATSGGNSVTIENATAGTGKVTIPNGATMLVYTDGANVFEGITAANGGEIVTTTGTQTLTNKTLTAPKFADGGFIADPNGNEILVFDSIASAVNEITVGNAASSTPTATITIASPCVVTVSATPANGTPLTFTTTGALPTGLSINTTYYVKYIDSTTFNVSATPGGASINTSGSQSGTHTANFVGMPIISTSGTGTDISLNLTPKGAGTVQVNGVAVTTVSGAQTLSDKTLAAPKFADLGYIADANGNELIVMDTVTSAVNEITVANAASPSLTATMTIASPCVVTVSATPANGTPVSFSTTGSLPTGISAGTTYYVKYVNSTTFNISATPGGSSINTSGTQSGTHTANFVGMPSISTSGTDTNVSLNLTPKGSGTVQVNGVQVATIADIPSGSTSTQSTQTGSYTLVLTDAGKTVTMDSSSANTLTVPTNASVAFPTGTRIDVLQLGAGQTSIVGDTGVNVYKYNIAVGTTAKIAGQYAAATLWKQGTNTWYLVGNLTT